MVVSGFVFDKHANENALFLKWEIFVPVPNGMLTKKSKLHSFYMGCSEIRH